ncbi:RE1-silencing transcription factor-like [Anopheles aquasalis]|uniref:RE1-silencing transcription factor-like n=1 Tax=Anopheles aquasalis TaxID=42839 RepID=UPI00215AC4A0|nr:RE1-silencing transcription factor-like [Anopheles aquasalis]
MANPELKRREEELQMKRVCRFCLEPDASLLSKIYEKESKPSTAPLTLQIMACVAVEVYPGDGMPEFICSACRGVMEHSYQFKQICKKADTLLKSYLTTGEWPAKLTVPKLMPQSPPATVSKATIPKPTVSKVTVSVAIPKTGSKQSLEKGIPSKASTEATQEPKPAIKTEKLSPRIIVLGTNSLQQIKKGQPVASAPQPPLTLLRPAGPQHTSTPIVRRPAPKPPITVQAVQLAEPEPVQETKPVLSQPRPAAKKPKILNGLGKPVLSKVEESFVSTGDGTVQMVIKPTDDVAHGPEAVEYITGDDYGERDVFPCSECDRSFPLKQLLDIHKLNHSRERNFPCEECDKRFFTKYDLAKHMSTHTGERPYVCVICRAAFSRSTLLTRHQTVHKDQPKYRCVYCGREFLAPADLGKHMANHEKTRPFQCSSCPKSFRYKQGLERHEVTHAANQPFKCEYCHLSFMSKVKLSRHLTAHAGSRPYPCRMCSKSFLLSHHLTRHLRSHGTSDQAQYRCSDCEKVFKDQNSLIYHSAQHATESLTCPLCREHFEDVEQVVEHIQCHSDTPQFLCDYCDLMFISQAKLEAHWKQMHLNELAQERSSVQHKQIMEEDGAEASMESEDTDKEGQQKQSAQGNLLLTNEQRTRQITIDGELIEADMLLESDVAGFDEGNGIYLYDENGEIFRDQPEVENSLVFEVTELELTPKEEENNDPLPLADPLATRKSKPSSQPNEPSKAKTTSEDASKKPNRQTSLENYFNKDTKKTVSEVLKNLPKGVTVKMPTSSGKAQEKPVPPAAKEPKVSPAATAQKRKTVTELPVAIASTTIKKTSTEAPKSASTGNTDKSIPPKAKVRVVTKNDGPQEAVREKSVAVKAAHERKLPTKAVATAAGRPSVAVKRPGEPTRSSADEGAGPSKRPMTQRASIATSNAIKVDTTSIRAMKRVTAGTPVGKPIEMKVGGEKIKMHKVYPKSGQANQIKLRSKQ